MVDVVGLRFVAEGEREATEAVNRFKAAQTNARAATEQLVRAQNTYAGVVETSTQKQVRAFQTVAESHSRLTRQELQDSARRVQMMQRSAAEQERAAQREARSIQQGAAALQHSMRLKERYERAQLRLAQSGAPVIDISSRLRQQFLATANSIAILDGPLGGIASRFSAFGVLLGRTGILLATVAVGFTALGASIGQAVRIGMAAETSMLSLEAAVRATGGAAGVTARQIEGMARTIELQTLASRDGVRQAAVQLLTFEGIAGPMFERTLRVSQDIAQAFRRDIVAVSLQVAKALENPAQSLASLERAYGALRPGIRATVIALVEQGRQTEAMNILMAELERRFNGAGQAAAAGLAGQLDTLQTATTNFRQRLFDILNGTDRFQSTFAVVTTAVVAFTNSLDTLARIAQVVAIYFGARGLISVGLRLYAAATAAAATATLTLGGALAGLRAALVATGVGIPLVALGALWAYFDRNVSSASRLRQELDRLRDAAQENIGTTTQFTAEMSRLSRVTLDVAQANLEEARARRAGLAARQAEMEAVVAAESSFQQLLRRRQGLVDALQSPDLSVQEAFSPGQAERMRAELAQIEEQLQRTMMAAVPPELRAAFADLDVLIENFQTGLENAVNGFVVLGDGSRAFTNDVQQSVDAFLTRVAAQERELELLNQGLTTQQARTQMERDALVLESERLLQRAAELEASQQVGAETQQTINRLREAAGKALELADNLDKARQAADARAQLESTLEGLQNQLEVLDAQIVLLEQGVDFTLAQRLAEIEVQRARVQTRIVTKGITDELATQLAMLNAMSDTVIEIGDRQARVAEFRPARGGGGRGAGREVETLEQIVANMERQIEQEIRLIGLHGEERRALELTFEIQEQLRRSGQNYTEEAIQNAAREIAAFEARRDALREMREEMDRLADTIANSFGNAFMSIVDGTKSAKDAFKDMARQIISELFRVLVVQQLVGQFRNALPALNIGAVRSANGNVFTPGMGGPNVIPFAKGGVVGSPTMFPMAGGRTGLMGEAGPEAIMPLKRGKDGKLGVQAQGGGTVNIVQNFNVAANGDESVKRIVAQQVPAIAEATKAAVIDSRRRGGQMRAVFR